MNGTFFFVHGTGVREPNYGQFWGQIQERAKANGFDGVTFVGCRWGPDKGANLSLIPASLPVSTRRGLGAVPTAPELEVARWALLLEDPLFELRVAARGSGAPSAPAIGAAGTPDRAAAAMTLAVGTAAIDLTNTAVGKTDLAKAAAAISSSRELARAATAIGKSNDQILVHAIARAIVAQLIIDRRDQMAASGAHGPGTPPLIAADRARRDRLVGDIADAMAPGTRGIVSDWLRNRVADFAKSKVTEYVRAQRDPLMRANIAGAADILYYQRRGDEIRTYLRDALQVARAKPPVVAVAHSLGGELLADVLKQADAPKIELLVTVGTQISLFHAVDGLGVLRPPDHQPPFPLWLNVYDQNDFLSYVAKPTFVGGQIEDVEISSGVPFPDAHGAYWYNDQLYQEIKQRWP